MSRRRIEKLSGCVICEHNKPLLKSHVVPNFFRRWLAVELGFQPRFTSPHSGITRYNDDLSKHRLCCEDCEALMSKDESLARKYILGKWRAPDAYASYESWLLRFAAGLAIKAAAIQIYSSASNKSEDERKLPLNIITTEKVGIREGTYIKHAMKHWRNFLLGQSSSPGESEIHVFFIDLNVMKGLYAHFGHFHITYGLFSAIIILLNGMVMVCVCSNEPSALRRNTRISVKSGVLGLENNNIPSFIYCALERMSAACVKTREIEAEILSLKQ